MTIENPIALLALIGVVGYVFHLWLGDYRSRAREMRPVSPLPGATETTSRAVAIACAGAFVLLLIEVWGEHRLGISEAQSKITWLFAIYTLFAAFGEELLFRGYLVIEKRGRVVFLSSVIGFSLIFAALHGYWYEETEDGYGLALGAKGLFTTAMLFVGSLWFYYARFAAWNATRSLIPAIAAHLTKNLGVIGTKLLQGHVAGLY